MFVRLIQTRKVNLFMKSTITIEIHISDRNVNLISQLTPTIMLERMFLVCLYFGLNFDQKLLDDFTASLISVRKGDYL